MIVFTIFLVFLLHFSDTSGAKFRFDYTFSKAAEGWLKLHVVPATWGDARLLCHAEGAVLASPLNCRLRDAIIDYVSPQPVHTIFTGVHTIYTKGVYASIEGVPLERLSISWAPGEPDNLGNSESCLAMLTSNNGTMKDVKCSDVLPFVCYKKRTKTHVITGCGTHDTDYTLNAKTGSCYKFHQRGLTWQRAYMTCMAEGGHLIVINSAEESIIVKELYAKNPNNKISSKHPDFAAIGIFDTGDGGSWMTIHGETLKDAGFDRWHPGQPENATQPLGEFCGVTDRGNGNLFDAPCNWIIPFICEKKPESLEDSEEIIDTMY